MTGTLFYLFAYFAAIAFLVVLVVGLLCCCVLAYTADYMARNEENDSP